MPPQQSDRLLDLFNELMDFRAHFEKFLGRGCSGSRRRSQEKQTGRSNRHNFATRRGNRL
jgi:hypothetical protein